MTTRIFRRSRRLSRPVAVAVAAVVGLAGVGGAAGALLGELGGTSTGVHRTNERHHVERFDGRLGADGNDDAAAPAGPIR
jgi:hypothetical protein